MIDFEQERLEFQRERYGTPEAIRNTTLESIRLQLISLEAEYMRAECEIKIIDRCYPHNIGTVDYKKNVRKLAAIPRRQKAVLALQANVDKLISKIPDHFEREQVCFGHVPLRSRYLAFISKDSIPAKVFDTSKHGNRSDNIKLYERFVAHVTDRVRPKLILVSNTL